MKWLVLILFMTSASAFATAKAKPAPKMATNKAMNFDSQTVEGEIYRPDYSVVTGESPGEGWGLLRLRKDFNDHSATDRSLADAEEGHK